jgi:hypothetical protein
LPSDVRVGSTTDLTALKPDFRFTPESRLRADIAPCPAANSGHHQVRASMQGKPKRVGRRSNWNKIGKHGHAYEPTPEPSTRGVVDIT